MSHTIYSEPGVIPYPDGYGTVRVWRLGSLEHRILPADEAIRRLVDLLNAGYEADNGVGFDLVWDAAIDVIELKGTGVVNVVTGPDLTLIREGNVVRVEKKPEMSDEERRRWDEFEPGDMK